jgi:hypothetical protein
MTTRRVVLLTLLVTAAVIGSAYYYFYGREYVYQFTEAQLQQALSERLPLTRSYFVFQITLDHPRVTLVDRSDRVLAGLDVTLNVRLGEQPLPVAGSVDASAGIRYDPKTGQLFLTQSKIEHLVLQGMPGQYSSPVAAALSQALNTYYASHAIYTLDVLDAKQLAARLTLKSVVIRQRRLVVTLGIGA